MQEKIWVMLLLTLAIILVPVGESVSKNLDEDAYHNISIMTYGSAHNFKVAGFHRNCWGKGNDSYVLIVYYGPSLLPRKCKIWNESMEEWIDVVGMEIYNFSGWMIYFNSIFFQPYIVFVYGKCDELRTFHVRTTNSP
ncbi:MAG: hypothetical protein J7L31_02180 [Thermoplasmata archaeon]|nr:hypothetical protein [Thermoplasmata archaeon]